MLDWVIKSSGTIHRNARLTDLAKLFRHGRLPLLQAALGLPSTTDADAKVEAERTTKEGDVRGQPLDYLRQATRDEIRSEMTLLVHERDAPSDTVVDTP
jgi:hypothetical protein